jgi:hypothetical protein
LRGTLRRPPETATHSAWAYERDGGPRQPARRRGNGETRGRLELDTSAERRDARPDLEEEVRRLRRERDRLRAELRGSRAQRRAPTDSRRIVSTLLVALTVVAAALAVPAVWVRGTIMDGERYVAAIAPLADDPDVREFLARRITAHAVFVLRLRQLVSRALPEGTAVLAAPLSEVAEAYVRERVEEIMRSPTFSRLWREANRFAHARAAMALDGDRGAAGMDGPVSINLVPFINLALRAVHATASGLIGGLPPPRASAAATPGEAITRLELALGIDLRDDFGQVPVFRAQELGAVQQAFRWSEPLLLVLVVLAPVLAAAALWLSPRRRRTVLQLAVGGMVAAVVVRRLGIATTDRVVDAVQPGYRAAARAVLDRLLGPLLTYTWWMLAVAAVALVVGLATGPYPWARRLRGAVASIGTRVVAPDGGARAIVWVAGHRNVLMAAVATVAILALLGVDLGLVGSGVVIATALVIEAAILAIARIGPRARTLPRPLQRA